MATVDFLVGGTPFSHQTKNKPALSAWKQAVRDAAAVVWGTSPPLGTPLKITVTYYHEGPAVRIDNDNLVKPIQDALIGLVYADDRLITDTVVRKTNIDGPFRVRGLSMNLLERLALGAEFIHVVIDAAPGHETPPG